MWDRKMISRNFRIVFPAGLVGLMLIGITPNHQAVQRPPNFVIIYADDLGYADIGSFGAVGYQTPNLDRMAKEGVMKEWIETLRAWVSSLDSDTAAISANSRAASFGEPRKLTPDEKLALLQHLEERQADRPFTEAGDTVAMLQEARAGAMWGYEPDE